MTVEIKMQAIIIGAVCVVVLPLQRKRPGEEFGSKELNVSREMDFIFLEFYRDDLTIGSLMFPGARNLVKDLVAEFGRLVVLVELKNGAVEEGAKWRPWSGRSKRVNGPAEIGATEAEEIVAKVDREDGDDR